MVLKLLPGIIDWDGKITQWFSYINEDQLLEIKIVEDLIKMLNCRNKS